MKKKINIYEIPLFNLFIFLTMIGLLVVYSASSTKGINIANNNTLFLSNQITRIIISFVLLISIYYSNIIIYLKKYSILILIASWALIIWGIISTPDGASVQRTLFVFGRSVITTSDPARLAIIIFTASFINSYKKDINNLKIITLKLVPYIAISIGLILYQPDLSSAFIILIIIVTMLIVGGMNFNKIFFSCLSLISNHINRIIYFKKNNKIISKTISVCIIILILFIGFISFYKTAIKEYQINRFKIWYNGIKNIEYENLSKQQLDAYAALNQGGLIGIGPNQSLMKEGVLPEAHTDYILAITAEEYGLSGIILLFIMFFTFYFQGVKVSKNAPDIFYSMLSIGITYNIVFYFLYNASYVVGLTPPTGITLPFFSYGGSHTIITGISIGILMNISKYSNIYKNKYL